MDSGSFPPSNRPKNEPSDPQSVSTEQNSSKSSDEPISSPKTKSGLTYNVGAEPKTLMKYQVKPLSDNPLPKNCPEWFQPWKHLYTTITELDTYFQNPEHVKEWLDGEGIMYNRTILMLMEWDEPANPLTDAQTAQVDDWIIHSFKKCPIPPDLLPRTLNHLNKSYKATQAEKTYFNREDQIPVKKQQSEENEFIPEWMHGKIFLEVSVYDAFRGYWNLRNSHYTPGKDFLTSETLQKLDDILYCWLIKFKDHKLLHDEGFTDNEIELIGNRLLRADNSVNKILNKKKYGHLVYTWKDIKVIGTMEEINARTHKRLESIAEEDQPRKPVKRKTPHSDGSDSRKDSSTALTKKRKHSVPPTPDDKQLPESNEMPGVSRIKSVDDIKSLADKGPFEGLTDSGIESKLFPKDSESTPQPESSQTQLSTWFKRTTHPYDKNNAGHRTYLFEPIDDMALPETTLADVSETETKTEAAAPILSDVLKEKSPITVPDDLLTILGLSVKPEDTSRTLSPDASIKLLEMAQSELSHRLYAFPDVQKIITNLDNKSTKKNDGKATFKNTQKKLILKSAQTDYSVDSAESLLNEVEKFAHLLRNEIIPTPENKKEQIVLLEMLRAQEELLYFIKKLNVFVDIINSAPLPEPPGSTSEFSDYSKPLVESKKPEIRSGEDSEESIKSEDASSTSVRHDPKFLPSVAACLNNITYKEKALEIADLLPSPLPSSHPKTITVPAKIYSFVASPEEQQELKETESKPINVDTNNFVKLTLQQINKLITKPVNKKYSFAKERQEYRQLVTVLEHLIKELYLPLNKISDPQKAEYQKLCLIRFYLHILSNKTVDIPHWIRNEIVKNLKEAL